MRPSFGSHSKYATPLSHDYRPPSSGARDSRGPVFREPPQAPSPIVETHAEEFVAVDRGAHQRRATPAEINARFKYRKPIDVKKLISSKIDQFEDFEFVILASVQTLMPPSNLKKYGGEGGQVPCEGYFIVVDTANPECPVFAGGFLLASPPRFAYSQTKDALKSLQGRIESVHGIDPQDRTTHAVWKELERKDMNSMVVTSSLEDVRSFMIKLMHHCNSQKVVHNNSRAVSTALFVTQDEQHCFDSVKLAIQWMQGWMQGQKEIDLKHRRLNVVKMSELFPGMEAYLKENPGLKLALDDKDRCAAHPRSRVNQFSKPFTCAREQGMILYRQLCAFAESFREDEAASQALRRHGYQSDDDRRLRASGARSGYQSAEDDRRPRSGARSGYQSAEEDERRHRTAARSGYQSPEDEFDEDSGRYRRARQPHEVEASRRPSVAKPPLDSDDRMRGASRYDSRRPDSTSEGRPSKSERASRYVTEERRHSLGQRSGYQSDEDHHSSQRNKRSRGYGADNDDDDMRLRAPRRLDPEETAKEFLLALQKLAEQQLHAGSNETRQRSLAAAHSEKRALTQDHRRRDISVDDADARRRGPRSGFQSSDDDNDGAAERRRGQSRDVLRRSVPVSGYHSSEDDDRPRTNARGPRSGYEPSTPTDTNVRSSPAMRSLGPRSGYQSGVEDDEREEESFASREAVERRSHHRLASESQRSRLRSADYATSSDDEERASRRRSEFQERRQQTSASRSAAAEAPGSSNASSLLQQFLNRDRNR